MDPMIFWTLVVDGVVNGTIYALLAIGLVLVFVVTRVILLPQGIYVSFAALTLNQLQRGNRPGTVGLLRQWDLATGKLLREFTTTEPVLRIVGVSLSPNGKVLAAGSGDRARHRLAPGMRRQRMARRPPLIIDQCRQLLSSIEAHGPLPLRRISCGVISAIFLAMFPPKP